MPRTADRRQLNLDFPADLAADLARVAGERGTTVTALLVRAAEKICGRKPQFSPRKRGRPKKLEIS